MKDLAESRVLIVDDVPSNVDTLVNALKGEYRLSVAIDGEGALRTIEKVMPDLVLLDILMPGIDGYEVCRRLRASAATREIPVMFLSSLEEGEHKAKGFEVGGNDYLVKPFELIEVRARVRSLLRAKAYADAVKEKIAYDLRIAHEIQVGILPSNVASVAQASGLQAHALLAPAQQVGGDLYDLIRTPDGKLVALIGDVSGKGIPAALFMAVTTTLARGVAPTVHAPSGIIQRVNDALAANNPRNMFVTMLCAMYDAATGRLAYSSAGHLPPVLTRDGNATFLAVEPELAGGISPGLSPAVQSVDLWPGDTVIFYTDGVTEAFNAAGELFGETRLLEQLKQSGSDTVQTANGLLEAVRKHAGDHPQSDDIAVLVLSRPR